MTTARYHRQYERRQAATGGRDNPRPVATGDDSEYSASVEEALAFYEAAGLPRNLRSVQRYCANGSLDAHLIETPFGQKFLITPASVDRYIAYKKEVRLVATGRDLSRQAAVAQEKKDENQTGEATTGSDMPRQAATTREVSPPVAADIRVIGLLESENQFLKEQIAVKDGQIKEMTERPRDQPT